MIALPRESVLLLSARPDAHAILVESLTARGVAVRVARRPDRALRVLDRSHVLVLVDLEHGSGLDAERVDQLNHRPAGVRVVALHRGWIGDGADPVAALSVDGFCTCDAWQSICDALATCQPAGLVH